MIADITKASPNIRKSLHYNFKKVEKGQAEILVAKNLPSSLPLTEENVFKEMMGRIPTGIRTRNLSFHISLNPDPSEKIDDETFRKMAEDYMQAMGYGEQPYIVFLHHDIERTHIHIVSTRVDALGNKINDSNERYRSQRIVEQLERKYHLLETPKRKREERRQALRKPEKVNYKNSDVKSQIASVVRYILKYGTFQTIGELNVLLGQYNVAAEITKTVYKGKTYEGIVYVPTDDTGTKIGSPVASKELGRGTGLHAVQYAIKKSRKQALPYLPILKEAIQDSMKGNPDMKVFSQRMERKGILFIPRVNDSGRIFGVTFLFKDKQVAINGSHLGKQFSANVFNSYFNGELRGNPFILTEEQYHSTFGQKEPSDSTTPFAWREGRDMPDLSAIDTLANMFSSSENEYEEATAEYELQHNIRLSTRKKKKRKINR